MCPYLKNVFDPTLHDRLLKGELWLGRDLLKRAGLEDDLRGHLKMIDLLGQDILCLPISKERSFSKNLGYRYFDLRELKEAIKLSSFNSMALIDGPFQRLVKKMGLMKILTQWKRGKEFFKELEREEKEVLMLISYCLELSVDAIIIADDLAGENSTLVNPKDIEEVFSPFYIKAVLEIHQGHSYALFHSCGNIRLIIPQLVLYGFDGFAGIQHRSNDLITIKEKYGSALKLMAGIDSEIMEAEQLSSSAFKEFERIISSLARGGGFILSSSTGLYSGDFLERIRELYRIADSFFKN